VDNPPGFLTRLFISAPEARLRSGWRLRTGWRLAGHLAILLAMMALLSIAWIGGRLLFGQGPVIGFVEAQLISAIAFTASIIIARKYLDRRSFTSLGLRLNANAWRDFIAGVLIATLMVFLIYFVERLAGWLTITGISLNQAPAVEVLLAMLIMLGVFLVTGWQEELYFRGYLLTNLSEGLRPVVGILLSSLIFGLAHLGNPSPTVLSVAGICLFGLLMVFGLLRSGGLWLPVGLHAAWNFVEGPLLGFPVSGLSTYRLYQTQIDGNPLLTGGAFGPEAGLVLLPALALGAGLIWVYTRPRHSTGKISQDTP